MTADDASPKPARLLSERFIRARLREHTHARHVSPDTVDEIRRRLENHFDMLVRAAAEQHALETRARRAEYRRESPVLRPDHLPPVGTQTALSPLVREAHRAGSGAAQGVTRIDTETSEVA